MDDQVERGLAARRAGRGWADIADVMGVPVPKAKALLAEPLAEGRRKAAVAGGAHVPPDPECTECRCRKSLHTRRLEYKGVAYDDACSVCVEDVREDLDDGGRWTVRYKCDGFTRVPTPEERRQSHVARALSDGMTRSTLGAMYQLGINLVPNRYARWRGGVPPVQTARKKTQFKRAQKKLRREEARRNV